MPVFMTGDTGTGKEICAQALHKQSRFADGPFIPFHCAGHSPALFESALFGHVRGAFTGADYNRPGAVARAEGGTLFLDEIGDMPLETQARLLRFTQDYIYQPTGSDKATSANIRIICATNRDIQEEINAGMFRADLYYRLSTARIYMPPLRERGEDVIDLAAIIGDEILKRQGGKVDFTKGAQDLMLRYAWPRNIRELKNVLTDILVRNRGAQITESDFPQRIQNSCFSSSETKPGTAIHLPLWQIEKRAIENAIMLCEGNIEKAAAMLGIAASTIYRKRKAWQKNSE
jgi:two-component system repressor protein LuxO